jgi:hypothetical protein
LQQQDFETIDLKMSNQFPVKCKIADVRAAGKMLMLGKGENKK